MFIFSIFITLVAALVFFFLSRRALLIIEQHHYEQRAALYHLTKIKRGDIVFVGDSITDGGNWEELFPGYPVKNRGINGDTTRGVLHRIEDIVCCQPAAIFILIGTNDLSWWEFHQDEEIVGNYERILTIIKQNSPETRVFAQSILPRTKRYANHIQRLNLLIKDMSEKFKYEFIDLFPAFADEKNALRTELTNDHLHLMATGYQEWVKILTPYINSFGKK